MSEIDFDCGGMCGQLCVNVRRNSENSICCVASKAKRKREEYRIWHLGGLSAHRRTHTHTHTNPNRRKVARTHAIIEWKSPRREFSSRKINEQSPNVNWKWIYVGFFFFFFFHFRVLHLQVICLETMRRFPNLLLLATTIITIIVSSGSIVWATRIIESENSSSSSIYTSFNNSIDGNKNDTITHTIDLDTDLNHLVVDRNTGRVSIFATFLLCLLEEKWKLILRTRFPHWRAFRVGIHRWTELFISIVSGFGFGCVGRHRPEERIERM